jgi:Signal peptidase (SPase) II
MTVISDGRAGNPPVLMAAPQAAPRARSFSLPYARAMTPLGVRWRAHLALATGVAAVGCALDLVTKWAATSGALGTVRFNPRPAAQLAPFLVVVALLLVATSLAGSAPLDLATGVLAGGAFGNILSAFAWRQGIPDFIPAHGVLLNGADLAIAVGVGGLVTVALVLTGREAAARAAR